MSDSESDTGRVPRRNPLVSGEGASDSPNLDRSADLIAKRLIGVTGRIAGDHPFAGCGGEIVRIDKTPWGLRPVVRLDGSGGGIDGHEVFVLTASEWRSNQ